MDEIVSALKKAALEALELDPDALDSVVVIVRHVALTHTLTSEQRAELLSFLDEIKKST